MTTELLRSCEIGRLGVAIVFDESVGPYHLRRGLPQSGHGRIRELRNDWKGSRDAGGKVWDTITNPHALAVNAEWVGHPGTLVRSYPATGVEASQIGQAFRARSGELLAHGVLCPTLGKNTPRCSISAPVRKSAQVSLKLLLCSGRAHLCGGAC